MKRWSPRPLILLTCFAVIVLPTCSVTAATSPIATVTRLGGDPDGYHPRAPLVDGGDGFFYGTTVAGGPPNCGTVFKVAPNGTLTTLYAFAGGGDGANPIGGLVLAKDGSFYGTTSGAGSGGTGTVFKITAAGDLTTIYSFAPLNLADDSNSNGAYPEAALIQGSDGNFYGTAYLGGTAAEGTVFRITPAGKLTTLASFGGDSDFFSGTTTSALVEGSDGNFYGTEPLDGPAYAGSIFQVTPAGVLTTVYTFTGGSDGSAPQASLIRGNDGNLYGTTAGGGNGTFFQLTPGGAFTTLHTFNANTEGQALSAPLTLGRDGNFYGTTGKAGTAGYGTAFQITPAGVLTVLAALPGPGGSETHSIGNGLLQGTDGDFYGTTYSTGNGDAGTIFQVTPAGALTTLHLFHAGGRSSLAPLAQFSDGNFYGVTERGGATDDGTMFEASPSGDITTIHSFNSEVDGSSPAAGLVADGTGAYYGTCALGGSGGGGVFYEALFTYPAVRAARVTNLIIPDTSVTTRVPSPGVTTTGAGEGLSTVVVVPPGSGEGLGTFYSVAEQHGDFGGGGILMYPPGGPLSYVYQFGSQPNDGYSPRAIVAGPDGNVYGVTLSGGVAGLGTVFRYTPGGTVTVLHSFAGTGDGALPQGGVIFGNDGNLYGTTGSDSSDPQSGAGTGNGTIFRMTPDGTLTTIHTFASDGSEGVAPMAALLQASDDKLYGVTSAGGNHLDGVVFSITTDGMFAKVGDLFSPSLFSDDGENEIYGSAPVSPLIEGSDGNLYGTTSRGGTEQSGIVYRVTLNPDTVPNGTPAVTLAAAVPSVTVGSGQTGVFLLTIPAAQTTDLHVAYTVKGTGVNGTDYAYLKGTAKIKAGKTSKAIKVTPQGDLGGASKKTVVLVLAPGDGYTVGTTGKIKVKILGN